MKCKQCNNIETNSTSSICYKCLKENIYYIYLNRGDLIATVSTITVSFSPRLLTKQNNYE